MLVISFKNLPQGHYTCHQLMQNLFGVRLTRVATCRIDGATTDFRIILILSIIIAIAKSILYYTECTSVELKGFECSSVDARSREV